MDNILKLLENDATLTPEMLAKMCRKDEGDIRAMIEEWEKNGVILGRRTLVDWERAGEEKVRAMIEVKINHKGAYAYDKLATKIRNYPEVKSLYLMSGGYDLCVMIEGKTMREVAYFVAQKLAPIEDVISTATHFVLRKYKDKGVIYGPAVLDERGNLL